MFKQRNKFKEILLSLVLIFSLLLSPIHSANAWPFTFEVNQATYNTLKEIQDYVLQALKTSVLSALMNVATMTTQKLAYDAAMYLTAGGSGQQSLFEPRGWKEYGKMLGEQAMGEFVGSLSGPWSELGINICEPSPLQKLEFQKAFTKDINVSVPKLQMASAQPTAPKCDWNKIKSSYSNLAQSVKDFDVDMSFDLNINLTPGGTMTTDELAGNIGSLASNAQQSLSTLSAQLTSLTEKLYAQGIDLSKLWTSSVYIKKMIDTSLDGDSIPEDSDANYTLTIADAMFDLRKSLYTELDKKVRNLQKSLNGERKDDATLKKTLNEPSGDLYFWKEFRSAYDGAFEFGNEDSIQAVLEKYLLDTNNINKLLRQQVWDRLLVMQLISDKKISNDLMKYVYYADIDKYVKSSGDGFSNFVSYIQPGNNPSSVGMALSDKLSTTTAQYAQKAQELADNKGFKAVTDVVSGRVKTPADLVQEQYKQTTIKDPSATKQTTLMGAYFSSDVGMALLNTAVNTFTSTVFNNLMNKVYSGLFKPDQMIANDGVSAGLTQTQLAKKLSANVNIQMISVKTEMTDYNVLNEYAICPDEYATANNCVLDSNFLQALQGNQPMSLSEAVGAGLLNADWNILPKSHSMNADPDCFEKAFCYDNLQKLRHSRIISSAWELVGDLCENKANIQYCSVDNPFTLKEALTNFYNCGQDDNHPYHILCNLIDPNWILKLPAQKCQTLAYGSSIIDPNMSDRQQYCADDVSCVQEDANGACLDWGYCTREKNVWRFSGAQSCLPEEDSCRSFADSQGNSFSFLKNTLLLDDFNTCTSENIGCAWYSKNKTYDDLTGTWQWQDDFNANNEATDRAYLTAQTPTCSVNDEGCSRLVRALPRLGTNLLPNSDFLNFVDKNGSAYYESWKTLKAGSTVVKNTEGALLTVTNQEGGLSSYQSVSIISKKTPRYFIYSATLLIPQSLLDKPEQYNWNNNWRLSVDAYKPGNTTPRSDYLYDVLGDYETDFNGYYQDENYFDAAIPMAKVNLSVRFTTVPDVDRLSVAVLLSNAPENTFGNQVIIKNVQLEEVSQSQFSPSPFKAYALENLVYLKKAPDYYQCYQNWYEYNEGECLSKTGYWDSITERCEAPDVCSKFAPYCSIDEVGCTAFFNVRTGEAYNMVVSPDDYCPAICAGYEKLYEAPGQFSDGRFVNLIASTANICPASALGCEEFTAISDDGTLENKYYFAYDRTCQIAGASDCQTFYTWDNPDGFESSIKSYNLKALDNQPVVTEDDSALCNEDIYNQGIDPYCYKFYAVRGGEEIDLNDLDSSAYVSYHLIDKTVTCSNDCKPYRLSRSVTEAQCLSKGAGLNKFDNGTCTVYAILDENPNCSALNVGCREYRGSRSHSYFTLLMETFEMFVDDGVWKGGARVKEAVQKDGYSWQNLGSNEVSVSLARPVNQDQLYLLTFWARHATAGADKLQVSLTGAEKYFTEEGGVNLDARWQRYVLGPVEVKADSENPILLFSGMNVGNLFIDNVELREVDESYYFIANSWNVSDFCDKIPDANITVPGYMLGCDEYQDSYGYKHYLKSFTANCRPEAVGCELVIDTKNNFEGSDYTYNSKPLREIGNLVLPLIESEAACSTGGYIWERGHCHRTFSASPINRKQCELWGYYWLGTEDAGKCVNDTVSDDVAIAGDKLMTLVLDQDYLCAASANGCSAYGKAVTDADDQAITCDLGAICESAKGCLCRQESTNDYICTVAIGQETCQMDTIYAINDPLRYESNLCTANAKGCDQFTDSQNSIWYFRNPGNRLCEYKELRIEGQLKTGWFKKGTEDACYPDYRPGYGLWGGDQALDYHLAGIDDLKNYDFYVGSCSVTANMCTKFIDPTADSSAQRNYYFLDNGGIDNNSCNGQVNLAEGCVLLNNTAKNTLTYSAEKTYVANFQADYQPVAPQIGKIDKTLNPLTGYVNPYYMSSGASAIAAGFVRVDLGDGIIQNYPYVFPMGTEGTSSGVGVVQSLDGLGDSNSGILLPGNASVGNTVLQGVSIQSLDTNTMQVPETWADNYENVYRDVIGIMAQQGDEDSFVNNSNTVVKVQRDRACAEWLAPADQETVYDSSGKSVNTTFNLLSCQYMSSGECTKLAPALPPQYLDARLYALRGFGWNALDYSGYSLPNRYSLADYKQIYLPNEDRLALVLDWKESCNRDSDCDVAGSRCLSGRCYDVKGGQVKYDQVACRAYPEASSPFIYSLGNPLLQSEQVNRCYPMTGYCADQFSGTVKDYNKSCYSDLECDPLQRCVFDNKSMNDDCDCDYTKLTYSELGGVSVYTGLNDDKLADMGLCSGGVNDGLPCFGDNECLGTQNRTMFRATSTLKVFQNEQPNGRCVFPSSAQKQQGWKGFCLEKDDAGQCITWWPVNRLLGDEDIYYQDKTVGLPYLNRYYCLHEDTLYKRVLVGEYAGKNNDTATVCVDDGDYSSKRFKIILNASQMYKTDIYYIRKEEDDRGDTYCSKSSDGSYLGRTPIVPFYPGAIVKVEGKNNFNFKWHTSEELDLSDGVKINGPAVLEYIKNKWEGQSCFYMLLDVTKQYPQLFCDSDDDGVLDCDDSQKSPIVVACSISDKISEDSIISIEIPMILNLADMVALIRQTYAQYQNRCVVEWSTIRRRTMIHDLFNHICEYQNIRQKDYPLLFNFYADKNKNIWSKVEDESTIINTENVLDLGNRRFSSANIGGTEKICDLMAEIRDEEGNHMAYTDNFSKDKALSLWNVSGKDYVFDAGSKIVYATDTTALPGAANDYRIPSIGNLTGDDNAKIQYYLSHRAGSYKILPIVVPRALVKNKLDLYTSPQPFGAIIGNNLYQPYVLPKEGSNLLSGMLMIDDDEIIDNNSLNDNVECKASGCDLNSVQNRVSAQLKLEKANEKYTEYKQNQVFALFDSVYKLKEYTVRVQSKAGEVPMLFANKVMSTYQDSSSAQFYVSSSATAGQSIKYADEHICAIHDRVLNLIKDIGKNSDSGNVVLGVNLPSSLLSDTHKIICKQNYVVRESGCGFKSVGGLLTYTCSDLSGIDTVRSSDNTENISYLYIQKPSIQLLNQNPPPSVPSYTITNNKQLSLDFYARADKNALPLRKLTVTWGDKQQSAYDGFIQNHQETCDSEAFINPDSVELLEALDDLNDLKTDNRYAGLFDASSYGTCGPVCINWPQSELVYTVCEYGDGGVRCFDTKEDLSAEMAEYDPFRQISVKAVPTSGTDIKGTICYDTDKTKLANILRASGENIPSTGVIPAELEGRVYGTLYKQSLRCGIAEWDKNESNLCFPVYNMLDGTYIDSLCENDANRKLVLNALDFYEWDEVNKEADLQNTNWVNGFRTAATIRMDVEFGDPNPGISNVNPVKDDNIRTLLSSFRTHFDAEKRIYDLYTQGAAGDRKNCVDKPFSFKHWYQNITTTDAAGNYVCNFGTPLDGDGDVVANATKDVVYCKLTGKIEIEDNMGKASSQDFTVLVPTRLILNSFASFNASLQPAGTSESTITWMTGLNLGGSFVVPKPPSGGFTLIPLNP